MKIRRVGDNETFWSDPEPYTQIVYNKSTITYDIDRTHRQHFQLLDTSNVVRIYARPMFHDQIQFLVDILKDETIEAWVVGELTSNIYTFNMILRH